MKFFLPRKVQLLLMVAVILFNIIFLIKVGHVTVTRGHVAQMARHILDYKISGFNSSGIIHAPFVTDMNKSMPTIDPKRRQKIETIRRYLNESSNARSVFPAMQIGNYIMVDPNRCRDVNTVDIVILVHTAPANLIKRQRMRDSFAKDSLFFPFHVRIAFLLGRTPNATLQRILWLEHVTYNDTVQGNFIDHYHNLTLKGVMGYKWVKEYCSNSKFVLKIDDDVLVNMYKLLYSFTGHMNGKKKTIFCNLWHKSTMGILRKGKWKVSDNAFFKMRTFPYDYCSGFVVLFTSDLMGPLYEAGKVTPFFWIDDVYLFGMLPSVVGKVTYYNYALDKNITLNDKKAINCTRQQGHKCPIFATIVSPNSYWSYWKMITDIYSTPNTWKVEHRLVE